MVETKTDLEKAEEHAGTGRKIVARQEALIRRTREAGRDVRRMDDLLALFKATQEIFEADVRRLQSAEWARAQVPPGNSDAPSEAEILDKN